MLKLLRDKRFAWIPSLSAAVVVLLIGLVLAPAFERKLETVIYDRAMRGSSITPTPNVVVITVDQASTDRLGAWPWPRSVHAQLLKRLHDAGTHMVAFTLPMGDPQNRVGLDRLRAALDLLQTKGDANSEQTTELKKLLDSSMADLDDDRALTDAIALHGNVLLPIETLVDSSVSETANPALNDRAYATASEAAVLAAMRVTNVRPPAATAASAARGLAHNLLVSDSDNIVRSDVAAIRVGDRLVPSLAVAVAASLSGIDVNKINFTAADEVIVGEQHVPLSSELRWRGALFPLQGERALIHYSYWKVLDGDVGADQLRARTVVVGLDTGASMIGFDTRLHQALPRPAVIAGFAA
ncbi:MAG TPA: CHASE2 domain-containing protein, partial [Steroidobacteraceae bacterium]|nr:CHASE2 domain-containing protein [Steroidobacteraceae bacterium]